MSSEPKLTRRVVTGVDAEGRSAVVSDGETPTWVRRLTGSVIMDIWRADALPAGVDDESTQGEVVVLAPGPTVHARHNDARRSPMMDRSSRAAEVP